MNITKRTCGSILLEILVSIVILGLIAVGFIFSYSFVYQRIDSQRQQRIILGMLQGWMEHTISSLLDPENLKEEDDFRQEFKEDTYNRFYRNTNNDPNTIIDPNIVFIEPNIRISSIDGIDDIIDIRIWITLSNTKEVKLSEKGMRITLFTKIYPNREER